MNQYNTPTSYYKDQLSVMEKATNQSTDKILTLWQHILLVSSGIDGVLISLHGESPSHLYIRVVFFLSVVLLSAGVSCSAIVLYDLSMLPERVRQKFCKEFENAIQEDRRLNQVTVGYRKRTVFCQKCAYWCFGLSLLSLLIYSFLREFPEILYMVK